jgi:hypothetical protein
MLNEFKNDKKNTAIVCITYALSPFCSRNPGGNTE